MIPERIDALTVWRDEGHDSRCYTQHGLLGHQEVDTSIDERYGR